MTVLRLKRVEVGGEFFQTVKVHLEARPECRNGALVPEIPHALAGKPQRGAFLGQRVPTYAQRHAQRLLIGGGRAVVHETENRPFTAGP